MLLICNACKTNTAIDSYCLSGEILRFSKQTYEEMTPKERKAVLIGNDNYLFECIKERF